MELISIFTPEIQPDPYPTYKMLRERCPVYREPQQETYLLFRYDDITDVATDTSTFSSTSGILPENPRIPRPPLLPPGCPELERQPLLNDDPPLHDQYRALVNGSFTPPRMRQAEPWVRAIADELLDHLSGEEVDIVDEFTTMLPIAAIAKMLDIPPEQRKQFLYWTSAIFWGAEGISPMDAYHEMEKRFAVCVQERRRNPGDDLISQALKAGLDKALNDEDRFVTYCIVLVTGGSETTTHLVSNMLDVLAQRPEVWAAMREDRSLVKPAVEEGLRFESPTQVMWRMATRDTEIRGVPIKKTERVGLVFGAGNRDPQAFPDPDAFDIRRDASRHLAFGFGPHYCMGAPLARMEAQVAFNALLDRFRSVERGSGERRRVRSSLQRGWSALSLRLKRA